jgi:hypothetical protein
MSLSQEIVDSIITRNNLNANEKIYDALYGKAAEQIGVRKVEIAQNLFSTSNYEDDSDYYEQGSPVIKYEDEYEEVPEETYEQ